MLPLIEARVWHDVKGTELFRAQWYQAPQSDRVTCEVITPLWGGRVGKAVAGDGYCNRAASLQDAVANAGIALDYPLDGRNANCIRAGMATLLAPEAADARVFVVRVTPNINQEA